MIQETLAEALQDRAPAVRNVGQYFTYDHLSGAARLASEACCELASRELADHLVSTSNQCEFLTSKGQVRITFDLRPAAEAPVEMPGEAGPA